MLNTHTHAYTHTHTHTHTYTIYTHTYIYTYTYTHTHTHTHTYIHTHIHTYTHTYNTYKIIHTSNLYLFYLHPSYLLILYAGRILAPPTLTPSPMLPWLSPLMQFSASGPPHHQFPRLPLPVPEILRVPSPEVPTVPEEASEPLTSKTSSLSTFGIHALLRS